LFAQAPDSRLLLLQPYLLLLLQLLRLLQRVQLPQLQPAAA
jgi:hypothetical protein